MSRFGIIWCGLAMAGLATVAVAEDEKQRETCAKTSEIVSVAVSKRVAGVDVDATKDSLMEGDGAVAEKYQLTVGPLVDWVFGLEPDVIGKKNAASSIAATYQESCLGYKP